MKRRKYISLFFVCIIGSLCLGIFCGYQWNRYFSSDIKNESDRDTEAKQFNMQLSENMVSDTEEPVIRDEAVVEVSAQEETVNADTTYVVWECDMDTGEMVETTTKIPQKFLGMTREQMLENLQEYEENPPLTELERGFVSLELLTFSTKQVEVQMNYQYVKPSESFYVVAYDNYVVVMLEDKKTVYLDTVIMMSELPEDIQQDVLQGLYFPDEESLYDFLENYTS